jgi:hypothetical protein
MTAFEQAQKWYAEHRMSLLRDLAYYHRHGVVISRPDVFGMAELKPVNGELTWFIRFASGNMVSQAFMVAFYLYSERVKRISWYRQRKEKLGSLHCWPIERFLKHTLKLKGN